MLSCRCFRIATSAAFDYVITLLILANVGTMMLGTHDSWGAHVACFKQNLFYVNLGFCVVFILECLIKLLGLGPRWSLSPSLTVSLCLSLFPSPNGGLRIRRW
jgi:hypothetical protein